MLFRSFIMISMVAIFNLHLRFRANEECLTRVVRALAILTVQVPPDTAAAAAEAAPAKTFTDYDTMLADPALEAVIVNKATSLAVVASWSYLIYSGSVSTIWPMFGIANQLLAGLALQPRRQHPVVEDAGGQIVRNNGGSARTDERKRDAGHGRNAHRHPDVDIFIKNNNIKISKH